MPSIRWGLGTGADLCVPFLGNVALSGCRLIGAGGADDDIALAWNEADVDANTVSLWRMNEAAWNGTAGEVVDASGNGNHGQSLSGANTASSWLNRYADFGTNDVWAAWFASIIWGDAHTLECWWYPFSGGLNNGFMLFSNGCSLRRNSRTGLINEYLYATHGATLTFYVTNETWNHVAVQYERGGTQRVFVNGIQTVSGASGAGANSTGDLIVGRLSKSSTGYQNRCYVDDMRLSDAARYSDTFSPARYKSAAQNSGTQPYAQASYAGLAGMVPAEVSWSATAGDLYGKVKRILVNDVSAGWTAVGGNYPTSPVTISGLVLASADAVRVELEPKADALQSETPVLDWLHLEYTLPVTGGRVYRPTPLRFGPKLLPIGVLA